MPDAWRCSFLVDILMAWRICLPPNGHHFFWRFRLRFPTPKMPRFGCGDLVKWEVYPSKAASLFSVSGSGNSSALNLNSLFQEDLVTPKKLGPLQVSQLQCVTGFLRFLLERWAWPERISGLICTDPPSFKSRTGSTIFVNLCFYLALLNRFISSILEVSLWVVFFVESVPGQKKGLQLAQATVVLGIDVQSCAVSFLQQVRMETHCRRVHSRSIGEVKRWAWRHGIGVWKVTNCISHGHPKLWGGSVSTVCRYTDARSHTTL